MILEVKRIPMSKYADYYICNEIVSEYIKWMEYPPILSSDKEVLFTFKKYLASDRKENTDLKVVQDHINTMTIKEYAKRKLNSEEYDYCQNLVSNCSQDLVQPLLEEFLNKPSIDMKDEFIIHLLKKKSYDLSCDKLNHRIVKESETKNAILRKTIDNMTWHRNRNN